MTLRKDYFCENCDRIIFPFELQSTGVILDTGEFLWLHKECGKKKVVRVENNSIDKSIVDEETKSIVNEEEVCTVAPTTSTTECDIEDLFE